jgi:SNF2 family DNA or RNA helicase
MDDAEIPYDEIPQNGNFPMLFITHYEVFTNRKERKKKNDVEDQEDVEQNDELAKLIEKYSDKSPQGNLDALLAIHWDAVILDEAHRIKNRKTGWTKNIKKLKADFKHVMTGTGFINRPDEIWSLFHFLEPRQYTSYWRFREKYCWEETDWTGFKKIRGVNPDNADEFRALVRAIGPRRTKREVFPNLPEPIYSPIEVDLNKTQRMMYDSIKGILQALDQKGKTIITPNVLAALSRLRQVAVATPEIVSERYDPDLERMVQEIRLVEPSSKLDALMEVIDGLEWDDERRDQVVVFSNFKDPIELAKKRFEKRGISYLHMEQKDSDQVRYQKWSIEFPKKEHQVFICTLQLGSESISLTPATTCVFLDRSWSPKDNSQAESRVWRPGQEEVANIIHINARRTVDERVLEVNEIKQSWFKEIFG